jgi:hypothetical protein
MEDKSEVARLRQRIQEEYEAALRAMNAPAITASHKYITARMENMQNAHVQLQAIVGEKEGTRMMAETLDKIGGTEGSESL